MHEIETELAWQCETGVLAIILTLDKSTGKIHGQSS